MDDSLWLHALAPSSFGCSVIMASSIGSHRMTAYGYMYSPNSISS